MELPSIETVNDRRIGKFKARITAALEAGELEIFRDVVEQYETEHNVPAVEIAAALAKLAQGKTPLLLKTRERAPNAADEMPQVTAAPPPPKAPRDAERMPPKKRRDEKAELSPSRPRDTEPRPRRERLDMDTETYRVEVGHTHQVKPGNIVGAIANEAGLDSKYIGRIQIFDDHSLIDLPAGMPKEILHHLKKVWVAGQMLRITPQRDAGPHEFRSKKAFEPRRAREAGRGPHSSSRPEKPTREGKKKRKY
jgi:ATP-dependent RNA helicase DeaD